MRWSCNRAAHCCLPVGKRTFQPYGHAAFNHAQRLPNRSFRRYWSPEAHGEIVPKRGVTKINASPRCALGVVQRFALPVRTVQFFDRRGIVLFRYRQNTKIRCLI